MLLDVAKGPLLCATIPPISATQQSQPTQILM